MPLAIRSLDPKRDRRGIEAIDTSFQTDVVYDLVTSPRRVELVERRLAEPLTKRYSIAEVFAAWARWDVGWVAEDASTDPPGGLAPRPAGDAVGVPTPRGLASAIRGVAVAEYEAWHDRLVLWHLYVAPAWRRRGAGRALLAEVEAHGRRVGASHVWLETSNVNAPGIAAYERLGYTLCGADRLFYGDYMPGETAIYLAKRLA